MITSEGRLILRWYEQYDLRQLTDLHRCCFPLERWMPNDFNAFVHNSSKRNNVVKVLADESSIVYGSMLYTLGSDNCQIRRLAVWPDYRRRGFATFMLNSLCGPRSLVRRSKFSARVRENNVAAQLFFDKRMGFTFDPRKTRERDEERNLDYYEFTLVKPVPK